VSAPPLHPGISRVLTSAEELHREAQAQGVSHGQQAGGQELKLVRFPARFLLMQGFEFCGSGLGVEYACSNMLGWLTA
jgi:hypothetical protein